MGHLRAALAVLLLASAVAFAVGAAVERSRVRETNAVPTPVTSGSETGGETGAEAGTETGGETGHEAGSGEELFGINPESTGIVVAVVVASLVLALAVWRSAGSRPIWIALAFGLAAAALDLREVIH